MVSTSLMPWMKSENTGFATPGERVGTTGQRWRSSGCSASGRNLFGISFARGGDFLYAARAESKNRGICCFLYKMPILGGAGKQLIVRVDSKVALSPDGKRLAFVRNLEEKSESLLILANAGRHRRAATIWYVSWQTVCSM